MKNTIYLIAFIFFLCSFTTLLSQDEAWERIIPTPQEHDLYCIRQIPGTDKIVAAGGGSTIMYSDDYGESWDITLNAANLHNSTTFLSIGFSDENTGYAVTYNGEVIKTTDGGSNWVVVFETDISYKADLAADMYIFHADTAIIIGIENLILKTTDGGTHWDTTNNPGGFFQYSIHFADKNTGYIVGQTSNSSILKTIDKGENWVWDSIPYLDIVTYTDIYFINDTTGFLVGKIYGSTAYILKTYNSGNDWNIVFTSTSVDQFGEIKFKDKMHGSVRTFTWWNSFVYTEDGGESWIYDDDSFWYNYSPCYSFIYEPEYLLGVGRFGRIGKSYSMEESWHEISHDWDADNFIDADFISSQTAYALHQSKYGGVLANDLRKTTDGGHSWDKISLGYFLVPGSISFPDEKVGYVLHEDIDGVLLSKTTDGADSWSIIYNFGEYDLDYRQAIFLTFLDSLQGVAAFRHKVFKTQDGGISWESILTYETWWEKFTSVLFLSTDSIFITGDEEPIPFVIKSNDGGETFETDYIDLEHGNSKKVYFLDHSVGFLLINHIDSKGGRIYKTIDGGDNWYETIVFDTNYIEYHDIFFPSDEIGYAVGEGNTTNAFKTLDGGETWQPFDISCTSGLKFIHFFDDWHGLVFGDNGVILETFSGGVVGLEENPFVTNISNISVFPNPAQNKITIQLEESATNDIYLELYNLQGKCLVRKYYPNASLKQNISLDISKLPPGLYTCRVKNGKSQSTSKVVKL